MYVATYNIKVIPLRDAPLPPFTSKVTRTVYAALWGEEPVLGRMGSFSVLFREGRPLYKRVDSNGVLFARTGELLECRVSVLSKSEPRLPESSQLVSFGGSQFRAVLSDVEVVSLEGLSVEVPRKFVLRFLTPTLLPVPGRGDYLKSSGVRRRYKLFPDLALALRLLTYDLKLHRIELVAPTPFQVYKWAYRALAELDYRVRPETILYTVNEGRSVTERGFTGYVMYELLDTDSPLAQEFKKLLAFALRFGIGKSRSIGFGHVSLEPARPHRKTSSKGLDR
ncbi:MAG: CRISPR system precrRNA processing endoribonuclease RAMP protein Cas6 [Infirmifilum sp.]|mgnify:CR=1 FL=1|uniref:CRISPR system precrRNA processing endoribonuclease RAMP protein Cas6 n=1 Tax=Infirmifilum sp. TaxID=2856575 RepID=UPI003C87AE61